MQYEPVVGLEIHAELATESKLFCGCSNKFGAPPNSQVCPVCMGLPGVLPVVNEKAVEYMIRTALALNCRILKENRFDRKNYYYPDLPKNYQISQQYLPFARDGWVEITVDGEKKRVGIGNIHLEEDAGKNLHSGGESSLVDLNRTGIPLAEIVTKPDLHSLQEVDVFMSTMRDMLLYLGVSDCKMEQGSLRFEANVSLREKGSEELPPRVEMKNLNSFKIVLAALEYEIKRQQRVLEEGGKVSQETRLWDEESGISQPMRGKEEAQDYRYFPEPDLPPLVISEEEIERVRRTLPELPDQRRERFVSEYSLSEYDTGIIISSKEMADFFEACVKKFNQPKEVANWLIGPVSRHLNEKLKSLGESKLTVPHLVRLLTLIEEGKINPNTGKQILSDVFESGKDPTEIVQEKGLIQVSDESQIETMVDKVVAENPGPVNEVKSGKDKAIGFLIGQVMRLSKGKANPQMVNKILKEKLE